jgi:ComF family protein
MPTGPWADVDGGCAVCRRRSLGFDAAYALGPYRGPIRELCLKLKRPANGWVARWLPELLVEKRPRLREEAASEPGMLVVPVPLHWSRRWSRGYNQAEELAQGLARSLGLRMLRPLRRVVRTPLLATLGRVERAKLLKDAFEVRSSKARAVRGRSVLLVDDVLTTGATCGASARALKRAGAERVIAAVIGRAEGRF